MAVLPQISDRGVGRLRDRHHSTVSVMRSVAVGVREEPGHRNAECARECVDHVERGAAATAFQLGDVRRTHPGARADVDLTQPCGLAELAQTSTEQHARRIAGVLGTWLHGAHPTAAAGRDRPLPFATLEDA